MRIARTAASRRACHRPQWSVLAVIVATALLASPITAQEDEPRRFAMLEAVSLLETPPTTTFK
jgi:hypothetical protein